MKLKLIYVEWMDSCSRRGVWHDLTTFDGALITCRTIGWLVKETDESVTVAGHYDGESCFSGGMTIPKVAITKRKAFRC